MLKPLRLLALSAVYLLVWAWQTAQASLPMDGFFTATANCPAYHSIRKQTNPGGLHTEVGKNYPLKAKNRAAATHYLIELGKESGLNTPQQRWVAVNCGKLQEVGSNNNDTLPSTHTLNPQHDYVLAVSWQPAFCQTHRNKTECRSQHAERYDALNLSLHGLWPQPRHNTYCGVDTTLKAIDRRSAWHLLPNLTMSAATRRELARVMPGTTSYLHKHQWYKHGTCYGTDPETYFRHSIRLMQQINRSAVRDLFAQHIGQSISISDIRRAFDQSFGQGAGDRVYITCSGKLLNELKINLRGSIQATSTLGTLIRNAPSNPHANCHSGIVDPAGF